jgi:uncharacterized membrane protein YhdT
MLLNRSTALVVLVAMAIGEVAITYLYVQYYQSLSSPAWFRFILITLLLIVVMGTPRAQMLIFKDVSRNKTDNRIIVCLMLIESLITASMILYLVKNPH